MAADTRRESQAMGALEPPRTLSQKMNRFLLAARYDLSGFLRRIRTDARKQILVVSIICLLCPGLFNALAAMGGSAGTDINRANQANMALYIMFTVSAVFAGIAFNHLGPATLMGTAGFTYALYSFYQSISDASFHWLTVLSGGVMGVGAACLWTSQGAVILTYPTDDKRGSYMALSWAIFNLGGVIGGIIVVCFNSTNTQDEATYAMYYIIAILMTLGSLFAFVFVDQSPLNVIRRDNTRVPVDTNSKGIPNDIDRLGRVARMPQMLLLVPYFLSSNFFYTSRFNDIQFALFNSRTRGLNTSLYWATQSITACLLGPLWLDLTRVSQRGRAVWTLLVMAVLYNLSWVSCLLLELEYGPTYSDDNVPKIDWTSSAYIYPTLVLLGCAVVDSAWQVFLYWLLGCFAPDINVSAHMIGLFKCIQSFGAAVAWGLGVSDVSNLVQIILGWVLINVAIPPALVVAVRYTRGPVEPDPQFSDYGSHQTAVGASTI